LWRRLKIKAKTGGGQAEVDKVDDEIVAIL
jgi:hypothetical protein